MRTLTLLVAAAFLSAVPHASFGASSERPSPASVQQPPTASKPAPDEVLGPERRRLRKGFDQALKAFEAERYAEAAAGFEELLAKVEWPEASFNAAWARYVELDLPKAESHAAAAVRGMANDAEAARLHALVLHDLGRHADAQRLVRSALELVGAEGDITLRARLELLQGSTSRLLGRYRASQDAYRRALGLATEAQEPLLIASAHLGMGHVALSMGDATGAAEA
ncbi:MAG: tetratricopeptide repeat protein, partial [Deltaproteobacteria bacterium]|nr:tetratricopeptide repeat protein [Deltaproteobacteria bacterium]